MHISIPSIIYTSKDVGVVQAENTSFTRPFESPLVDNANFPIDAVGQQLASLKPERIWVETVEMIYLGVIVVIGVLLNAHALHHLLRQSSRTPTAFTSFISGPYHASSFSLFKVHLR